MRYIHKIAIGTIPLEMFPIYQQGSHRKLAPLLDALASLLKAGLHAATLLVVNLLFLLGV